MTLQRQNPRALAAARILENLAAALPPYRDMLHDQLRHTTGYPDHTPGAAPATTTPTKPLEGRCDATVVMGSILGSGFNSDSELVDCGRTRPCPEHDRPITLTPTEHTANTRQHLQAELADIDQTISTITLLAADLLKRARHAAPLATIATPHCDATGRDGYLMPRPPHGEGWSDLACKNKPSRGPLCDACAQRESRWRRARNLAQRSDGVWSQPAKAEP